MPSNTTAESDSTNFLKTFSAKQWYPKQRPIDNQRQMITPRNAKPHSYSGSNLTVCEDTSPFFFPWLIQQIRREMLWGLHCSYGNHWQRKKKIHSMLACKETRKRPFLPQTRWTRRASYSSLLPCPVGLSLPQEDIMNLERTRVVPLVAITSYSCRKKTLINSAVDTAFGSSVGGGKPLLSGRGGCKGRQ